MYLSKFAFEKKWGFGFSSVYGSVLGLWGVRLVAPSSRQTRDAVTTSGRISEPSGWGTESQQPWIKSDVNSFAQIAGRF